jgi:hypothetical protein
MVKLDTNALSGLQVNSLDPTAIQDNRITDIEAIDITGSGDNALTLEVQEVLNVSPHA